MTKAEELEKLKMLLGIDDGGKDIILDFMLDKASDMIKNYCRLKEVPAGLENIMISMTADMYRAENPGSESGNVVKGINEGDTSVTFGATEGAADDGAAAFLRNYITQLNRYRKMGW